MSAVERSDQFCDGLMLRVASGDREALGDLFASEAGRLIAIARRILRRKDLAEEAVQEGFIAAWKHAPRFDPARGSARAWLTTIVRNRALNMLRDGQRLHLTGDDMARHGESDSSADAAFEALDEADALKHCLSQLDEPRRRSILLAYVLGYTHGEIAAKLNAPLGTVKAWIRRGVIALQECLS
ncbi:sigma-70 family RNA polymerase sigma factor [Aminobacter sp. BA135]|uniref:sigma-70 family RNA polymerase sigma factor n=1 Tax=Aminobacter sp. BA135 TaxID=537596 RepID=UPI003D7BD0FB